MEKRERKNLLCRLIRRSRRERERERDTERERQREREREREEEEAGQRLLWRNLSADMHVVPNGTML
jgi:hypothetical protein